MAKLCKSKKVVNSKVDPRVWYYGLEHCRHHVYSAVPAGEVAVPLNLIDADNKYVELMGYIHLTNGGSDPAPAGLTKLATVDASAAADVAALNADIKSQLEASAYAGMLQVAVEGDELAIRNNFIGLITDEDASAIADLDISVKQQSFGGALGVLSEDGASAAFEFEFLDQTGDSTGNAIIERFLIGATATLSMSLTDTSKEKFEEIFIKPLGGSYENGADKLIGFGTANFFQSLMTKIGKVVGHRASSAYSDRSEDWQMLAVPNPTSINFNKELQVIECEFVSAYDATMPESVNIFSIGDMSIVDYAAL
jgi:hypothetical protein